MADRRFINYTYEEDADRAVRELNGKELLGHPVRLSRQVRLSDVISLWSMLISRPTAPDGHWEMGTAARWTLAFSVASYACGVIQTPEPRSTFTPATVLSSCR